MSNTGMDLVTGTPQKKVKTATRRNFYKTYVRFGKNDEMYLLDKKYVGLTQLGKGAYGTVVSALNTETEEKVAIKKVASAFSDISDAKRTLREVKMLMHLDHPNVCKISDIIPPFGKDFNDVYIVMPQMDVDLHRVIYSTQKLAHNHIKYFTYQIVKAVNYIHSAGIVHRDLKPSNILVNENCSIKICDFGLARACADSFYNCDKSQYVVTRWYRAPELLCYYDGYDKAVDNWSLGCILAEMYDRQALFNGKNYRKTLEKILLTVGAPNYEDLLDISRERNVYAGDGEDKNFMHNRDALRFCKQRKHWRGLNFANRFNHCGSDGADLIRGLLQFNPRKRITTDEVLEHPYLAAWRVPESEIKCEERFDESYEHNCFTPSDVKELTYEVVMGFRKTKREEKEGAEPNGTGSETNKNRKYIDENAFTSPKSKSKKEKKSQIAGKMKNKTKPRSHSAPQKFSNGYSLEKEDSHYGVSQGSGNEEQNYYEFPKQKQNTCATNHHGGAVVVKKKQKASYSDAAGAPSGQNQSTIPDHDIQTFSRSSFGSSSDNNSFSSSGSSLPPCSPQKEAPTPKTTSITTTPYNG